MKNQRLKQFGTSLLIVLSLFVSSISAACTCAHENAEAAECSHSEQQQHSHEGASENHSHFDSAEVVSISESEAECCCAPTAPKVSAKAVNLKIEKQFSVLSRTSPIEIAFVAQKIRVKSEFVTPFYLTDSFHNLSPGRAPPVL